ncbi:preprotein translocase subunit SecE [Limosilactobacillus mucosae]|uniref:preprotein translocase subunit SecE n=1 Tax=Limosilactobacillus mucosae TaxID=97478 RepID=UPI003994C887
MYYLSRVWREMKKTVWEKPKKAVKETMVVLLVMIIAALVYYGYDWLMQLEIKKWF